MTALPWEEVHAFFDYLNLEGDGLAEVSDNCGKAIAVLAKYIPIGRVEACVQAPRNRLRPEGEEGTILLYQSASAENFGEPCSLTIPIADGGQAIQTVWPLAGSENRFTAEEKETLFVFLREIFHCFSRMQMKALLHRALRTDMDTGVASPEAFLEYVEKKLSEHSLKNRSVVMLNIRNFKYVNKLLSYSEGDKVLWEYADKVKSLLNPDDCIARLGGDNFVLITDSTRLRVLFQALGDCHLTHVSGGEQTEFQFGMTAGYGSLDEIQDPTDAMAICSVAYQAARYKGAGSIVCFSEEVQQEVMKRQNIISLFKPSLSAGEFVVFYQPKVALRDRSICGAEALVRWLHQGQLISPGAFVPILEEEGSICQLDYYVLEKTCQFLRRRIDSGKEPLCISVNFSRRHMEEEQLIQKIVEVIDRYGLDHSYLEIELTESEDYQDYEKMMQLVEGLKQNGIGTSMDDFGTGFSSLNLIKKVDMSVIKIDRSFIPLETDYPEKEKDIVMFCSMVQMMKLLKKKTVVEGVETETQLKYLEDAGCEVVQGYIFDRPLPENDFVRRLECGYAEVG